MRPSGEKSALIVREASRWKLSGPVERLVALNATTVIGSIYAEEVPHACSY